MNSFDIRPRQIRQIQFFKKDLSKFSKRLIASDKNDLPFGFDSKFLNGFKAFDGLSDLEIRKLKGLKILKENDLESQIAIHR